MIPYSANPTDFIFGAVSVFIGVAALLMTLWSAKVLKSEPKKVFLLMYLGVPLSAAFILVGLSILYQDNLNQWHVIAGIILILIYNAMLSRAKYPDK